MNKKLLYLLVIVLLLASCNASLQLLDEDGFAIYQCGWALDDTKWVKINANDSYLVGVACFQ